MTTTSAVTEDLSVISRLLRLTEEHRKRSDACATAIEILRAKCRELYASGVTQVAVPHPGDPTFVIAYRTYTDELGGPSRTTGPASEFPDTDRDSREVHALYEEWERTAIAYSEATTRLCLALTELTGRQWR